jgi:hypothetical protein
MIDSPLAIVVLFSSLSLLVAIEVWYVLCIQSEVDPQELGQLPPLSLACVSSLVYSWRVCVLLPLWYAAPRLILAWNL